MLNEADREAYVDAAAQLRQSAERLRDVNGNILLAEELEDLANTMEDAANDDLP